MGCCGGTTKKPSASLTLYLAGDDTQSLCGNITTSLRFNQNVALSFAGQRYEYKQGHTYEVAFKTIKILLSVFSPSLFIYLDETAKQSYQDCYA